MAGDKGPREVDCLPVGVDPDADDGRFDAPTRHDRFAQHASDLAQAPVGGFGDEVVGPLEKTVPSLRPATSSAASRIARATIAGSRQRVLRHAGSSRA